jgi:hypothetical protein
MSGGFFLLGTGVFKSPEQFKKAGGAAADEKLATAGLVRGLILRYTHRRTNLLCAFAKRISQVKPLSPPHRFLIALCSPDGVFETGLLRCPPEKNATKLSCSIQQCTFSGPGFRAR